jgi:hypothetical protein
MSVSSCCFSVPAQTHEPGGRKSVRLILNIVWLVLVGLWMAIAYAIAALICFVLIITIPFGIASLRIAMFALWPFGKTVVKRSDAGIASGTPAGDPANAVLGAWVAIRVGLHFGRFRGPKSQAPLPRRPLERLCGPRKMRLGITDPGS